MGKKDASNNNNTHSFTLSPTQGVSIPKKNTTNNNTKTFPPLLTTIIIANPYTHKRERERERERKRQQETETNTETERNPIPSVIETELNWTELKLNFETPESKPPLNPPEQPTYRATATQNRLIPNERNVCNDRPSPTTTARLLYPTLPLSRVRVRHHASDQKHEQQEERKRENSSRCSSGGSNASFHFIPGHDMLDSREGECACTRKRERERGGKK